MTENWLLSWKILFALWILFKLSYLPGISKFEYYFFSDWIVPYSGSTELKNTLYIYIYIYTVIHRHCFVVSQLFSVARHVGRSKLGSKPAQIYVRLSIRLGQQTRPTSVPRQSGNYKVLSSYSSSCVRLFAFYTLPDTRVLNSFEELCIMRAAAVNSFVRVLNLHGGAHIYIYIYSEFVCVCVCV